MKIYLFEYISAYTHKLEEYVLVYNCHINSKLFQYTFQFISLSPLFDKAY